MILAALLVVITALVWQWVAPSMYYVLNAAVGIEPLDADYVAHLRAHLTAILVCEVMFYTSLTATKLSMLLFFRRIGQSMDVARYVWWPVVVIVVCMWITWLGSIQFECVAGQRAIDNVLSGYCGTEKALQFGIDTLRAKCVMDVVSDFLSECSGGPADYRILFFVAVMLTTGFWRMTSNVTSYYPVMGGPDGTPEKGSLHRAVLTDIGHHDYFCCPRDGCDRDKVGRRAMGPYISLDVECN